MSQNRTTPGFNLVRALQKFVVSTFVICSFIAYALHEHLNANAGGAANVPGSTTTTQQVNPTQPPLGFAPPPPTSNAGGQPASAPAQPTPSVAPPTQPAPTATPATASRGQYKNGTYTGPEADAQWGSVQVQAVIQNGKLTNVQILDYPSDRRTSQRINSQALPWLQQEAIQAQNANVDIISGATLTSEAFAQSLQVALTSAKN